jgi:hypothetical protein
MNEHNDTLVNRLHYYRQEISKIIKPVRAEAESRPERGGPEISLAWRHLQMAKMFLGLSLGENNINPPWEKDGDN